MAWSLFGRKKKEVGPQEEISPEIESTVEGIAPHEPSSISAPEGEDVDLPLPEGEPTDEMDVMDAVPMESVNRVVAEGGGAVDEPGLGDVERADESSAPPAKKGLFRRLADGLSKTRKNLNDGFDRLIGAHVKLDESFMEELEEVLLSADIGVDLTMRIVNDLKIDVKKNLLKNPAQVVDFIKEKLIALMESEIGDNGADTDETPRVILVIGVNGAGKTTTIGKLTARLTREGKTVLLAAADTFRAAAIEQLATWAERSGADLVRHQQGSDPAAVVFDAVAASRARQKDVLIVDTAGRLHNKENLMKELEKIKRVIGREIPSAPHEVLLVLDGTTGQNAVQQARLFGEIIGVTGIVLTKLDGTAKGGVVINIMDQLRIPVKLIGVGEGIDDLRPFEPREFIEAIFTGASLAEE